MSAKNLSSSRKNKNTVIYFLSSTILSLLNSLKNFSQNLLVVRNNIFVQVATRGHWYIVFKKKKCQNFSLGFMMKDGLNFETILSRRAMSALFIAGIFNYFKFLYEGILSDYLSFQIAKKISSTHLP